MKKLILLLAISILISCQTVTISNKKFELASYPDYEQTQWFFLWGIFPRVNVVELNRICKNRKINQTQTLDTFFNQLVTKLTIGIIIPRTARVWCKK